MPTNITENIQAIQSKIAQYCLKYQRNTETVSLLAVSKTQPISAIEMARLAGQIHFGENYLQEAIHKITTLNDPTLTWHFIGHIQSNKTALIATHFDWAHSVDRLKIAQRLSQQRPNHLSKLNICLQVNLDQEPSKSGFPPEQLPEAVHHIKRLPNIHLRGLMSIPKPRQTLTEQRHIHRQLNQLNQQLNYPLDTLSMGMSNDLEAAIAEGATWVRIGTDIFGPRKPVNKIP